MSCNYAEGLSNYENKGKLGLPEKFDSAEDITRKVKILAEWLKESQHTVFHTGAGISTSAGIPDFRGPKGVWTLEKLGKKPDINISWDDAKPTLTHMAILSLERVGKAQYVVTQNIDGLHLRSGFQRQKLAELHGDMFVDKCNFCQRQFVRNTAVTTVGQKSEGQSCPMKRGNGRPCRGRLHDTILDWEDALPDDDLDLAISHSCAADLSICLGTTLQIVPSGNLPVDTKKRGGKLVICNLQPTKQDRHADLIINAYVDDVMKQLLEFMEVELLPYNPDDDPSKMTQLMLLNHNGRSEAFEPIEWTMQESWVRDKDLAERVKSRKVIRKKRNSTVADTDDTVMERKKIKTDIDSNTKIEFDTKADIDSNTKIESDTKTDIDSNTKIESDTDSDTKLIATVPDSSDSKIKEENGATNSSQEFDSDVKQDEPVKSETEVECQIKKEERVSVNGKEINTCDVQKAGGDSQVKVDELDNKLDKEIVCDQVSSAKWELKESVNEEVKSLERDGVKADLKEMIQKDLTSKKDRGDIANGVGSGEQQMDSIIFL